MTRCLVLGVLWQLVVVCNAAATWMRSHLNEEAMPAATVLASLSTETDDLKALAARRLLEAPCNSSIDKEDLQIGLRLGSQFLVNSQRSGGNFRYEYNWLTQEETDQDNPVRQAGALWGLTLLHLDDLTNKFMPAIRNGLQYFNRHTVELPGGLRIVDYPGQEPQKLGAVALLALSHIEVLRRPDILTKHERQELEVHLQGYLRAILGARTSKSNFYKFYEGKTGKAFGPTSPYYDGECLLALVKAAKYLGHNHLWPQIKASAEAGWRKNVRPGLRTSSGTADANKHTDSEKEAMGRMKGYYQWSNMAWYELMDVGDPEFDKYAKRAIGYSGWMVDTAPGPDKGVNSGYAFEGLIPAFVTAVRHGDQKLENKFACAIRQGVGSLHTLQVGHRKSSMSQTTNVDLDNDDKAQGGAQGSLTSTALRIDTTQHQLHALLMARRLLEKQALI